MTRTEAEFCREEAARLMKLAATCQDRQVHDQIILMASDWLERAKSKEPPSKGPPKAA